MIYMVRWGSCD